MQKLPVGKDFEPGPKAKPKELYYFSGAVTESEPPEPELTGAVGVLRLSHTEPGMRVALCVVTKFQYFWSD